VSTSNVPTGTSLYWQISGNGITSNDFSSGTLTGVGVIGSSGQFSLSHQLANDLTTEGSETLLINLYNDPALSVLLSSASVTVRGADFSSCSVVATVTGVGALVLSTTKRDPVTTSSISSGSAVAAAAGAPLLLADCANAGAAKRQASAVVVESIKPSGLCRRTRIVSKA
jgi:hypothetical protein